MRLPKFIIYLIVTYVIGQYLAYTANWPVLYALVTWPGTTLHELAHYLSAYWLQGSPTGFSIIPTWTNGTMDTLGHVLVVPNWFNAATVGLAPFALAPLTMWFVSLAAVTRSIFKSGVMCWLASCSWAACIPSGPDFEIARSYPQSWPLAFVLLGTTTIVTYFAVKATLNLR